MSPSDESNRMTLYPSRSSAFVRCEPMKPFVPVTSIRLGLIAKVLPLYLFKIFDGLRIIVGSSDVQPIPGMPFDMDGSPVPQAGIHQIVEPEFRVGRHDLQDTPIYNIHAHADQVIDVGLLGETGQ